MSAAVLSGQETSQAPHDQSRSSAGDLSLLPEPVSHSTHDQEEWKRSGGGKEAAEAWNSPQKETAGADEKRRVEGYAYGLPSSPEHKQNVALAPTPVKEHRTLRWTCVTVIIVLLLAIGLGVGIGIGLKHTQ